MPPVKRYGSSFSKRRQRDGEGVEPIEEVLPELPGGQRFLEVAIGGRDDPDSHLAGDHVPDGLDLAGLQDAQELALHLERHVPDLVEEDGGAIRLLEQPGLIGDGAVKAPRLCPKSSDSISVGVSAVQFTVTSGLSCWYEYRWIARATSSLPVPDSPRISTVVGVGATRTICSASSFIFGFCPMMKSPSALAWSSLSMSE